MGRRGYSSTSFASSARCAFAETEARPSEEIVSSPSQLPSPRGSPSSTSRRRPPTPTSCVNARSRSCASRSSRSALILPLRSLIFAAVSFEMAARSVSSIVCTSSSLCDVVITTAGAPSRTVQDRRCEAKKCFWKLLLNALFRGLLPSSLKAYARARVRAERSRGPHGLLPVLLAAARRARPPATGSGPRASGNRGASLSLERRHEARRFEPSTCASHSRLSNDAARVRRRARGVAPPRGIRGSRHARRDAFRARDQRG